MENQCYLTQPVKNFEAALQTKIEQASILYKKAVDTQDQLRAYETEIKAWNDESLAILCNSFNDVHNEYAEEFRYATSQTYNIPGVQKSLKQLVDNQKQTLATKQRSLLDTLKLVSVCDAVARPGTTDLAARANYTIEDKLNLLLDKLYDLYDDSHYPVRKILEGNGIVLKRYNDDRELAQILEDNGLIVKIADFEGVSVKLTARGAMHIEDKRKTFKESYDDINASQEEVSKKIDETLERLKKLGYGQEIIFDEIQELKELYGKVSKKNWGQIVKGKLVDLALAKLIEKDTLDFIYNALTNHTFRLP